MLDRGGRSTPRPGHFTPWRDPGPIVRRLVGPHRQFERVWKISPPPGFLRWTVHPIASRYIDHAIPAHYDETAQLTNEKKTHYVKYKTKDTCKSLTGMTLVKFCMMDINHTFYTTVLRIWLDYLSFHMTQCPRKENWTVRTF